jgi:hypothetical protein
MREELRRGRDEGFQEFVSRMLELLGIRLPEDAQPVTDIPSDLPESSQSPSKTEE